jgi:hypothetical protein
MMMVIARPSGPRLAIPKWELRESALMLALSKAEGIAYKPVLH